VLLCHRVLPAKALNMLEVLPGVVITVVAWVIMSSAFSIYLVNFNTFASTYASLSGVFAAMFFTYLAALVLILSGEVNRFSRCAGSCACSAPADRRGCGGLSHLRVPAFP
jgi:membrane protein